jgi:hypothetical protein
MEMKIFDDQGKQVGEIEKPGVVCDEGYWYEPIKYRPKNERDIFACDGNGKKIVYLTTQFPVWVFQYIPTPAPELLKAIGMKVDGDRPRECKAGDTIWVTGMWIKAFSGSSYIGTYRWHLVKADPAPVVHTSCEGCDLEHQLSIRCRRCFERPDNKSEHTNWTAKVEDAPTSDRNNLIGQADSWRSICDLCIELGYHPPAILEGGTCNYIRTFIRDLHRRANEEGYSVEEIGDYLKTFPYFTAKDALRDINDPNCGIKAVTNRRGTK